MFAQWWAVFTMALECIIGLADVEVKAFRSPFSRQLMEKYYALVVLCFKRLYCGADDGLNRSDSFWKFALRFQQVRRDTARRSTIYPSQV